MLFVISAPSGAGKTTIVREILKKNLGLEFSVSATTRKKRGNEINGKDYYFLSEVEFKNKIANGELIEYELVHNNYYGTLKSEVDRCISEKKDMIFDVDVNGAISLDTIYKDNAVLIFIMPPDIETLKKRLQLRNTEQIEEIERRFSRVQLELSKNPVFDHTVVNDKLEKAVSEVEKIIKLYKKENI